MDRRDRAVRPAPDARPRLVVTLRLATARRAGLARRFAAVRRPLAALRRAFAARFATAGFRRARPARVAAADLRGAGRGVPITTASTETTGGKPFNASFHEAPPSADAYTTPLRVPK